ncbi:glycosyltransferase family 4 protein [Halomonas sp. THAF12]|uniref:glycosyltransferase family 4 protein n=1 Tax=Halomonas sp. B23F22_10 TaxID=3459515 RepID=UPI00373F1CA2
MNVIVNLQPLLSPLTGIGHYTRELTNELLRRQATEGDSELMLEGLTGSKRERLSCQHPLLLEASDTSHRDSSAEPGGSKAWQFARRYLRNPLTRRAYRWLYTQRLKHGGAQQHALYWEPNYILLPWRGRSVVTVHDLSHERYPECHPAERVAFFNRHLPASLERATRINVVSQFTANELRDLHDIDAERIDIVPPAVADRFCTAPVASEEVALQERYRLPARYLLSVGTLEPRKNLARVLEAYASLPREQQRLTPLLLAGMPGWGEQCWSASVQRAFDAGTIRRLGYVPSNDLPGLYALASGFVYVSLYEGFGMPVLEAMAAGTPVLTASVTATAEVSAGAGIEVDPLNMEAIRHGLEQLLEDDHAHRISLGRERASCFSWSRSADDLLASFHHAMES